MSSCLFLGRAVRLHADGNAVLHLRHRRDAALRQPGPLAQLVHREAQQLQTYLPVTHAPIQVTFGLQPSRPN